MKNYKHFLKNQRNIFSVLILLCIPLVQCSKVENPLTVESYVPFTYTVHLKILNTPYIVQLYQSGVVNPNEDWEYAHLIWQVDQLVMDSEMLRDKDSFWVRGDIPYVDYGIFMKEFMAITNPNARSALKDSLNSLPSSLDTVNGERALRYDLGTNLIVNFYSLFRSPSSLRTPPPSTWWYSEDHNRPLKRLTEYTIPGDSISIYFEMDKFYLDKPKTVKANYFHLIADDTNLNSSIEYKNIQNVDSVGAWDYIKAVFWAAVGVMNGTDLEEISNTVDIAVEATPAIVEKTEWIKEYKKTYPNSSNLDLKHEPKPEAKEVHEETFAEFWEKLKKALSTQED